MPVARLLTSQVHRLRLFVAAEASVFAASPSLFSLSGEVPDVKRVRRVPGRLFRSATHKL